MKKYKMKLLILTLILITKFSIVTQVNANDSVYTITKIKTKSVVTYADKIEWKYKIINGKMYKRQYNMTTGYWIGYWVLVQ